MNTVTRLLFVFWVVSSGSVFAAEPSGMASKRWHEWRTSQEEFPLAAWSYFFRYPGTEPEYQLYKDVGFNFVQAPKGQTQNARKADLGLVIGAFRDIHKNDEELAELVEFANEHPDSAVAYSLKDEPVPGDFPAVAKCMAYIYSHDTSGALPIVDFRANWCVPYKRWNMTYETYFERFVEEVDPPVVLNCHYPLMRNGTTRPTYYANIENFRRTALQRDIGLMGFILVTAHSYPTSTEIDYRTPSQSDLNWMVNTYLSYGAQGLWFYNWRIKDDRFSDAIVAGESGRPTPLYPMVQKVNSRVKALGDTLMKLKSKRVVHTDKVVPEGTTRYSQGTIAGIHGFEGESFIISEFYNQDDPTDKAVYLMVVNKQHAPNKTSEQLMQSCSFNIYPDYPNVSCFDSETLEFRGLDSSGGRVSLELGGGEATLLILK